MKMARYEAIKSALVKQIQAGKLAPGDQLPSEHWLADHYRVSRMTARRAVTELVQEGLAVRQQGAGAFVASQRATGSLLHIQAIDQEIVDRGHQHSCRVLELCKVRPPVRAAKALGVGSRQVAFSKLVHSERTSDGIVRPIQLECRYIHPAWVPDYLRQDFEKMTPSQYLMQVAPLAEADHVVEAILPDEETAALLDMNPGLPCLKLTRTTYSRFLSAGGKANVVAYTELFHPGDRYQLGGHLTTGN